MSEKYQELKTSDILAEALIDWNVDIVFGLPGDGINGFIEALRVRQDKIKFVLVRHEESAALMSCAYAKYTGKIGVCVATSGPGAIHLLNGLYDAKADNIPVVAITGSTFSDIMNSGFLQDVNLLQLFSDVASYNTMINVPEQAEMAVDLACRTALSHKGVSHINIPVDVQEKKLKGNYSRHKVPGHTSDIFDSFALPNKRLIEKAAQILNRGNKIVILVGQGALNASKEILAVAEKLNAPIIKALLGKAVVPDDHPLSLGGIGMLGTDPSSDAMKETDTLLMIGTSFPYMEYLPKPGQATGIQIDIKPEKIGLRYPIEIGLVGDSKTVLSELLPLLNNRIDTNNDVIKNVYKDNKKDISNISLQFLQSMQKSMAKWNKIMKEQSYRYDNPIKPQVIANAVSEELKDNAIVSVDSGNNTVWAARFLKMRDGMKFSVSGTLATMACGLSYAIAAKIAFPDRQSIAFVGDGGFTMLMGEFATAVQYKLPIKIIILKNNLLGMIRWEQIAFLGNPEYAVEFTPIDYAKFAEACGGKGYTIKKIEEVKSIIKMAMREEDELPTIVEAYVDPYELPLPPKVNMEFPSKIAESFERGQPYIKEIKKTLSMDHIPERYYSLKRHLKTKQGKEKKYHNNVINS
ncbi:MAG TPA: thiamine pyrophosphate-dependent enzyme [Nitrososphaeraceae archaeon]|nr:thiamine pyrophosphate-dependent enzyme [Nitrososphaeraceae archaeon]